MELLILLGVVGAITPISLYLYKQNQDTKKLLVERSQQVNLSEDEAIRRASSKAKVILLEAEKKALETTTDAEKTLSQMRNTAEEENRRQKARVAEQTKALDAREEQLDQRAKAVDEMYENLGRKEKSLDQAKHDVEKNRQKIMSELEKIATMTKEDAKQLLTKQVEQDLTSFIAKRIKESEVRIERTIDEKAKEMLIDVMQKSATDYVAEATSTTIEIPSEDLKGKIIGKEGRNIRTLQRLTGVDIIVDEAPNEVTLSCFDPIRREVAGLTLQRLLSDGRVHPGSIEQTVIKVKSELLKTIKKNGEELASKAGFDDLPNEIVLLLGRFKYRFSYGQNLAKHSLEMVNIGAEIAAELNADVRMVKLACLLHDLGKVLAHEQEGKPHHHISGDLIRKYLKDEKLANAAESHHGDIEAKSLEAEIVKIADSISGSRPGARHNNHEEYVKRIRALEDIARQYEQVQEAYAIHAGREVRVIIDPAKASDDEVTLISHKIAKEIESTQNYPGSVTVTAIREFRVQNEAK